MSSADDKVKQRLFQQPRGCNSINDPIRPRFHPCPPYLQDTRTIKTEQVTLMTKSNGGFVRLVFESVRDFIQFQTSNLSISFRKSRSKLESYADDNDKPRLFQQWRGRNSNDPFWPVFQNSSETVFMST